MQFSKITWDDKTAIDRILQGKNYTACEYRFNHLYIWKDAADITVSVDGDTVFIRDGSINGFMMPITSNVINAFGRLERHCAETGESMTVYGVTAEAVSQLAQSSRYNIAEHRDLFDYLYSAEDLITLRGKKLHAKRNHLNRFKETYDYRFAPLTRNDVDECLEMEKVWAEKRGNDTAVSNEQSAITNALYNMDGLGLSGGVIRVDNTLAAFTVGQTTDIGMGIVHFEKANTDYDGIYTAINQMYAEYAFSEMTTVNRQEDMGIENLRKAKLSYRPLQLVEKYTVTLK